MVNIETYKALKAELGDKVKLVVFSHRRSINEIRVLYTLGHRDFGEHNMPELAFKQLELPNDIHWHFTGQLLSNKVKFIAPFAHTIHRVDSFQLLEEIDRQAANNRRVINCILQMHIAEEEAKAGFDDQELKTLIQALPKYKLVNKLMNVKLAGLTGFPSRTEDLNHIRKQFKYLKCIFEDAKTEISQPAFKILNMGMSSDYKIAVEEGSTMVRIGTLIFNDKPAKA
ncbi:MAG: YggS family pyridoxal phosphate-dependent enzyme [Chitinophagaceae bacterium]